MEHTDKLHLPLLMTLKRSTMGYPYSESISPPRTSRVKKMSGRSFATVVLRALAIVFFAIGQPIVASAQQPSLQVIGSGSSNALANAVSANGTVATGELFSGGPQIAFSSTGGTITSSNLANSIATSINSDGSVIAGTLGLGAQNQAFQWPVGGSPTGIGMFNAAICGSPTDSYSKGFAVSPDGSTIVGISASAAFCDGEAFSWTSGGGMKALGCPVNPATLCFQNAANGVSANGSVIVGTSLQSGSLASAAWSYSNGSYNCFLGACAQGATSNAGANAVTPDGTVIVGQTNPATNQPNTTGQGFVYKNGNVTLVGQLPGGNTSQLVAVSSNGSVAVGNGYDNTEHQAAVLWTPSLGLQRIDTLLAAAGVSAVKNWGLSQATGISADGTVIVGIGTFGNAPNGWIAVLPSSFLVPPQTLSVAVTGSGTVNSGDGGINCGSTCSMVYATGSVVSLTATPASGFAFTGWGGACSGVGTCIVTVNQGQSVSANFSQGSPPVSPLVAAVLPESRSATVNNAVTAFATIINTGGSTAPQCAIAPSGGQPLNFVYQTTNPTTNALIGTANTPIDIPAGAAQSFVIAPTPTAAFSPVQVPFSFACNNVVPAPSVTGLNTLLLSSSATPVPDIVALAATVSNDGIVHITGNTGQSSFAVATVNLGISSTITASANTGSASLPLSLSICQTNPATGQCISATGNSVNTTIGANATPTFAIFAAASGAIPFNPATNRIFVQFSDSGGAIRGATSVAVQTQ